jgi:hypothetical protein
MERPSFLGFVCKTIIPEKTGPFHFLLVFLSGLLPVLMASWPAQHFSYILGGVNSMIAHEKRATLWLPFQ